MNHYEARKILNVDKTASNDELKKAYRRCAMEFHPDRPNGDAVKFREAKSAYDFLLDNKDVKEEAPYSWAKENKPSYGPGFKQGKRPKLDDLDDSGWMGGGSGDFAKTYEKFKYAARYLNEYVEISLEEAFRGVNFKPTKIPDNNGGFHCVNIRRGIQEGELLKEIKVGQHGQMSEATYKVYAKIVSDYNITFTASNRLLNGDIEKDLEISPFMMILGGTIKLQTIDGAVVEVTIPSGLEANKLLRLEGKGYWTNETLRSRGCCYFRVIPEIKQLDQISLDELRIFINAAKSKYPNL